ncbi:MAG: BON domain-containing protein [Caldimonas sp.]
MDKSDTALKASVLAELTWDPAVKETAVGVAVKGGVVTLTGHLETYAEKEAALRAVRRVSGVRAIAVEIDVKLSPDHVRGDTDIAASIELGLRWHTSIPVDAVRVQVEHGWVTLQGEVEWDFQRRSAESQVRVLKGVVGISNEIKLRPKPQVADLSRRIEEALRRQALRDAQRIHISLDGSTVKLTGQVHSWQERQAAQGVAWSAPGVRAVINELEVA